MHASGLQAYYYMLSFRLSSLFERSSTSIPLSCILALYLCVLVLSGGGKFSFWK